MEKEDNVLIAEYLNGDEQALTVLINRHVKSVYNFVYRLTNEQARADDVTQETFVKVWKHLKKFRPNENFRTWLFAIARNTTLDHLRKKRPFSFSFLFGKNERGDACAFEETLADTEPTPEEVAVLSEQKAFLDDALNQIPPASREVLLLRYHEDLTFDEIGKALGKPLHTVKSQHRRALQALRTHIRKTRQHIP